MSLEYRVFDPLLGEPLAGDMLRLCERFGRYSTYAEDVTCRHEFAPEIPQRFDAAANFVRSGGRFHRREDPGVLASRTNYFRATYAYGDERTPGVEPFLECEGLAEAARAVHGRPVIVPNIVYANLLLPGQELAVHTDVPEFRGANRMLFPQWLLVAMHHSGLFDAWRMPIATAVAYFGSCEGGEFAFHPKGPEAPAETLPVKHDTAVVLDTDSVFHGVDRVLETRPLPPLRPGAELHWDPRAGRFEAFTAEGDPAGGYAWGELRFSVSWKAYCYEDEADRRRTEAHADDLSLATILDTLVSDLRERGRLEGPRPAEKDLALLLIDEFIRFPD